MTSQPASSHFVGGHPQYLESLSVAVCFSAVLLAVGTATFLVPRQVSASSGPLTSHPRKFDGVFDNLERGRDKVRPSKLQCRTYWTAEWPCNILGRSLTCPRGEAFNFTGNRGRSDRTVWRAMGSLFEASVQRVRKRVRVWRLEVWRFLECSSMIPLSSRVKAARSDRNVGTKIRVLCLTRGETGALGIRSEGIHYGFESDSAITQSCVVLKTPARLTASRIICPGFHKLQSAVSVLDPLE